MMDKEKTLLEVSLTLDTMQAHIKRLRNKGSNMHLLDIELLQNNTRKLYDKLVELELNHGKHEPAKPVRTINLPEITPKAEIPEKTKEIKTETVKVPVQKEKEVEKPKQETKVAPPVKKEAPPVIKPEKAEVRKKPEIKIQKPEVRKEVPKPEKPPVPKPEPETAENELETNQKTIRSTIDLFTSNAEESIGDKLGSSDEKSVAERMSKRKIGDLKQAIGINEKFLFINELFNGNLGKYNKAIDDLNGFPTAAGVNSYLIELKVAGQWADDNEAYLKLKELLERKMA